MASTKFIVFLLLLLVTIIFNIIFWGSYFLINFVDVQKIDEDYYSEERDVPYGIETEVIIEPPENFCKTLSFIVAVHVRATDFETRQTWRGLYSQFKEKYNFEIMFAIGHPGLAKNQDLLVKEAEMYGDMLQGNFLDTYHNITYKHLTHIYYINRKCDVPFVVKMDDDVAFKPDTFAKLLKKGGNTYFTSKRVLSGNQMWCVVWRNAPVRHYGKWNISTSEITEKIYPPYCSGFAYFTTKQAISAIAKASHEVNFFWVDDIFVTGFVARKALTKRVNAGYLFRYDYEGFKNENTIFSLTKKENLALWINELYKTDDNIINLLNSS